MTKIIIVLVSRCFLSNKLIKTALFLAILSPILSSLYAQEKTQNEYGESQTYWNKTLKQDWFEHNPNDLLVETVMDLKPGNALDVAMGEGRNAIFLAKKGWNVTGFDIANEVLDSIQKRANQMNLKIKTVHASGEDFEYGKNRWDLVVLCYVDIICQGCIANSDFISKLTSSVKGGGIVVYESYHRDYFIENWKDPGSWGCTEDQLNKKFKERGFKVLSCEASTGKNDWSDSNYKIIKFVAQKL